MKKMFASLILLCFSSMVALTYAADPATINVQIGSIATVVGYQYSNPDGYAFYGIPYAQPPTGQNRLTATKRKDPSGRVLAFHFGSSCHQGQQGGNFDEDCLFLNIWTPKMTNFTANKLPVLFYIHGGGLFAGSGNFGTDNLFKNLISRGIIMVSINYRLGIFGFFSSRDSTVPGNFGILDQIEAINWVRRYISYFGGDPNAITIDGESAGGESVSLLTLSPLTNGLIRGAIVESGSAFSPGVFTYSESQDDYSKQAAIHFGCLTAAQWDQHNGALMAQMLKCLQSKTAADLESFYGGGSGDNKWATVMDNHVFPDRLENLILKRPPIPAMLGSCNNESLGLNGYMGPLQHDPNFLPRFTRQYTMDHIARAGILQFYDNSTAVRQQAQKTFVTDMPYADDDHVNWVLNCIQMDGDMLLTGPTYREAMNFRQTNSPVYLYSFDYLAPGAMPLLNASFRGVTHTWELQYIFGYPGYAEGGWKVTKDDTDTLNYFGLYWANFVKYGNPTPAPSTIVWPRLGTRSEYMKMGPVPTPSVGFHPTAAQFWACTAPAIGGHKPAWCP